MRIILIFIFFGVAFLFGKQFQFLDSQTKLPVKSVVVTSENGEVIESDKDGLININENYSGKLTVTHVSYYPHEYTMMELKKFKSKVVTIVLEPRSYMTPEIVSTANFSPTSSVNSLYNVDIISIEIIEAQKAPTLREILINQANIRVSDDPALGSGISINGLSGQNVQILIDGVPMIGRENGNINTNQVVANNIDQIEIIEGPMSALYGSDALGGVVNIITKAPNEESLNAQVDSYYESVGKANVNLHSSYGVNSNFFTVDLGRNFSDGWNPDGITTIRATQRNPRETYFGNVRYDRKYEKSRLTYKLELLDEFQLNRNEPLDPPYNETGIDDEYSSLRINNTFLYKSKVYGNKYLDVTASYQYYRRQRERFVKDMISLERNLIEGNGSVQTNDNSQYFARIVFNDEDLSDYFSYMLVADFDHETMSGQRIAEDIQQITNSGIVLTTNIKPFEKLIIQPGLRGIYNSKYDAPLIPTLNAKFDITNNLNLRAGISSAFRAPDLKELNLEFVDDNHFIIGNPNLDAENGYGITSSINYTFSTSGNVFKSEAKYFYNNSNNLISLAQTGFNDQSQQNVYSYINVGEYKTQGGEVNFSYYRDNFTLNLATVLIGRWSSLSRDFLYSPEFTSSLIYYFREIDFNIAAIYKYTGVLRSFGLATGPQIGEEDVIDTEDLYEFEIPDYHNLDITLTKGFWKSKFELSAGLKNVFGNTNLMSNRLAGGIHSGSNVIPIGLGRTLFMGLRFKL